MADPGHLYLSGAEVKLLTVFNYIIILRSFEAAHTRYLLKARFSRPALLVQASFTLLASYGLYRVFRPK